MRHTLPRRPQPCAPASLAATCLALCAAIAAGAGALAGIASLAFETWAYAQSPSAPTPPTLKVFARETVVDITVTDAKGNPVHGLKQQDFTVKEDGKPQPIHSFEEFGANPDADSYVQPNLPPNTYTNRQPPPASSAVNILLLDGLNTAPPDSTNGIQVGESFAIQTRVKQGAEQFLKNMPPGTRVAVLNLTRSLRVLEGFTSDPDLLTAAVETMEMDTDGRASDNPSWCIQQDMRNRATLEALNQIAADVAAIKGKKNLIWFSAGFPTITDPSVNAQPNCSTPPMRPVKGIELQTQSLLKTYALLHAAQIAVYPIGARVFGSPIANPIGPGDLDPASQPAYGIATAEEQLSFESMAEATGGAAFYNTNDLAAAIAQAVDKGANYYTLSYIPPGQKFDYGHHSIRVALNPDTALPGLHLVYRQTYDAIDPATIKPVAGLTLATQLAATGPVDMRLAMGRAMPTSTQLTFNVFVEPSPAPSQNSALPILGTLDPTVKAKLKGKPLTRYGFLYTIPTRQLTFAAAPDGSHSGSLEVDIAAYDSDGKLVTGLTQTIKMPLTAAAYQRFLQTPYHFLQQIDLPPGALFLRLGILDPTSNKVGTLEIPLTIPKK